MKTAKLLGTCFLVVAAILSCKKENDNPVSQLNDSDNNFIMLAGINNRAEIETAKIAVSKTADTIVLSFAQEMLMAHTNAQTDLEIMGKVVGFIAKDTTDAAHAAVLSQLDTLVGRSFDSTYIHTQLAEHQAAMKFYADELGNGSQTNVRAYANTNLQNIQLHSQRADSIATAFY